MKQKTSLQERWFPLVSCMVCLFLFGIAQWSLRPAARVSAAAGPTAPLLSRDWGTDISDPFYAALPPLAPADLTAQLVSAPGVFTLPIVQQPEDQEIFVSTQPDVITQFRMPSYEGVTGLIAHNYLAGQEFYKLSLGQTFWVTYQNDSTRYAYRVTDIQRYQKLTPTDPRSRLIDLSNHQEMSATQVYERYYTGQPHVTFQTCLEGQGRLDWGLLFIVGEPEVP